MVPTWCTKRSSEKHPGPLFETVNRSPVNFHSLSSARTRESSNETYFGALGSKQQQCRRCNKESGENRQTSTISPSTTSIFYEPASKLLHLQESPTSTDNTITRHGYKYTTALLEHMDVKFESDHLYINTYTSQPVCTTSMVGTLSRLFCVEFHVHNLLSVSP